MQATECEQIEEFLSELDSCTNMLTSGLRVMGNLMLQFNNENLSDEDINNLGEFLYNSANMIAQCNDLTLNALHRKRQLRGD